MHDNVFWPLYFETGLACRDVVEPSVPDWTRWRQWEKWHRALGYSHHPLSVQSDYTCHVHIAKTIAAWFSGTNLGCNASI